jgi:hypothetical protein
MAIVGDHPAHGVRFDLERPNGTAAPWLYRGFAFTRDARFALEVLVADTGDVRVTCSSDAPADLAEKTRLLFRALYKQAEKAREGAPPRRVVRWRGEK